MNKACTQQSNKDKGQVILKELLLDTIINVQQRRFIYLEGRRDKYGKNRFTYG